MKLIVTAALLFTGVLSAGAQKVVDITYKDGDVVPPQVLDGLVGGQMLTPVEYVRVTEGSPYFQDEWLSGTLLLSGGKVVGHLELRLDLLKKEIHYKNTDGKDMIATTPVRAVTLSLSTGVLTFIPGTNWRDIDKALDGAWLQVLVNDKVSLLHEIRKKMSESTPYGGATIERVIADVHFYYLQKKGQFLRVRSFSDLPELFSDKKQAVTAFIRTGHLKGRTPDEYAQVVAYYNTLIDSQKVTKI